MASLRTLIPELGHNEALKQVIFGDENDNRKCVEHFMRTYEGKMPYFAFVLKHVGRSGLDMFITRDIDYAPLDEGLLKIKAELPELEETAQTEEGELTQ